MSRLRIITNPVDAKEGILHVRTDKVLETFTQVKNKHPHARIYIQPACVQNDVTPTNKVDEASLHMLAKNNDFDIVCQAGEAATIIAVVSLVVSLAMTVYTLLTMPKNKDSEQGSSNNNLSNPQNQQRIGSRIPDIFGTVKAVPDLIAPGVNVYENNKQVEEQLMCLGRGYYSVSDIRDGDTPFDSIEGASISIYDPGVNIVNGVPHTQIGDNFNYAPFIAKPSKSINDQLLAVPNELAISSTDLYFQYPNLIKSKTGNVPGGLAANDQLLLRGGIFNISDQQISGATLVRPSGTIEINSTQELINYSALNRIKIESLLVPLSADAYASLAGTYSINSISKSGSTYIIQLGSPAAINRDWNLIDEDRSGNISAILSDTTTSINLDGKYSVASISSSSIALNIPSAMLAQWTKINTVFGGSTISETSDLSIDKLNDKWVGWIEFTNQESEELWINLKAPQGLWYQDSKGGVWPREVYCKIEYQQIVNNQATGAIYERLTLMRPTTSNYRDAVGLTEKIQLPFTGPFRFRVCRTTEDDLSSKVADDVNVTDAYAVHALQKFVYDDLTIVRTRVIADKTALSIKNRQLSMIATRKLYSYASGVKSQQRIATNNFADIVCAVTEDPFIGRRSVSELDVVGLYQTSNYIQSYFGTYKATEFNHTFDQANQSYEETLAQIASVVFCNARRESGKIYFQFERTNPSSSILFNHRNKKPGSETRTEKFGVTNEYDGVEVSWIDPDDSWTEKTLKLPDENITNPKKIELAGVTNKYQAHFLAHRAWNKIRYQRETVQFTAYGEADLITINDRIAVTDDTIPSLVPVGDGFTQGEVVEWVGQNVSVSQPVQLKVDQTYIIHLQLPNGSIETMQVSQGSDEWHLVLERLPTLPLVTSWDGKVAPTVYSITLSQNKDSEAYLVSEKSPSGTFESQITAINYDTRYYKNDSDYLNNLIT
ncbi:host specificity factor TipJ family phage tail protein [Acinetobacter sp. 272263]|uniref:host specificity factor TipJ family phage tail protein n=1 Tax=Acinetobacter sp. 272263 TaxID=1310639 RepID=UPI000450B031|nr:host specificity factor TipJ family phage tail protein [Acinetobacter sp. 272263]EXB86866.1 phage tail family protein [Acinetobacter sp. 272263]